MKFSSPGLLDLLVRKASSPHTPLPTLGGLPGKLIGHKRLQSSASSPLSPLPPPHEMLTAICHLVCISVANLERECQNDSLSNQQLCSMDIDLSEAKSAALSEGAIAISAHICNDKALTQMKHP